MMRSKVLIAVTAAAGVLLGSPARAGTFDFAFAGPGVSGSVELVYGASTDARYPGAFVVTGISGTFSDAHIGIQGAAIGPLEPRNFATPDATNLLAPNSFSRFTVAAGLPPESNGFVTFDNLYWPGGSPPTATDYPVGGGFLDIYGLLFDIGGGRVVNFWSDGDPGNGLSYGVSVSTSAQSLDRVGGGVLVAEPVSLALLGTGVALVGFVRRRAGG